MRPGFQDCKSGFSENWPSRVPAQERQVTCKVCSCTPVMLTSAPPCASAQAQEASYQACLPTPEAPSARCRG